MAGTPRQLTVLIAARNAASTIERAIRSCAAEPRCAIVLADDHSTDDTVARAVAVGGPRVQVVTVPDPGGVAAARQRALDAVQTPFAAWLDADDEWLPGRADRLLRMLQSGYDIVADWIDLHDGPSGELLRRLEAPSFLRRAGGALRLFERNLLPGDTQVGFRTACYTQAGGFDQSLHGPESFDLLLRAVRNGARLGFVDEVGYRMYAYPASVSRQLGRQRASLAAALRKHRYEDVKRLYVAAGHSTRVANWALVMMAVFRNEPAEALARLDEASPVDGHPRDILEPDGPWPFPEGWRAAFHRGTVLLMLERDAEATVWLRHAESLMPTAEGANNLGVALARLDQRSAADDAFGLAASRFDGYLDATVNWSSAFPSRITTHPLRRLASRHEYGLQSAS